MDNVDSGQVTDLMETWQALSVLHSRAKASTVALAAMQERLLALGYRQTLKRSINWHQAMAISVQMSSPLVSVGGLYGTSLRYGGPAFSFWCWICGGSLTMLVALTMGELISAFPMSGGMYWWTATLALRSKVPGLAPYLSLLACRACLIGQGVLLAFLEGLCVDSIASTVLLITTTPQQAGYVLGPKMTLYIFCMLVTCHASLHCLPLKKIAQSAFWVNVTVLLASFVAVLVLLMPFTTATKLQSPGYALFHHEDASGSGFSVSYSFALALTMPIIAFTGYDASAHLVEETRRANATIPWATLGSVATTFLVGALLILSLNANIQNLGDLFDPNNATAGMSPFLQIWCATGACGHMALVAWYDRTSGTRYGRASNILINLLMCAATFFNALYAMTAVSRLVWAFARDGFVIGFQYLRRLDDVAQCPIIASWTLAVFCVIFYLPCLLTAQGYNLLGGMQTGGIYFSYLMPVALRASLSDEAWEPGVFSLGRWSRPVAVAATMWLVVQLAIAMLPTGYPVTAENMNWTGPCLGFFLVMMSFLWWVKLRHHFSGLETVFINSDLLKTWHFMDPPRPLGKDDNNLRSSSNVLSSRSTCKTMLQQPS